jgi:hypothetical protein
MILLAQCSSVARTGRYCYLSLVSFCLSVSPRTLLHTQNPSLIRIILTNLLAWMIAAFLPLPPNPEMIEEPSPSQLDLERQFDRQVGTVDDRSYAKALWWRNLNRIMAAVGTLLVGVIVSLINSIANPSTRVLILSFRLPSQFSHQGCKIL